jgi:hypothetical protein
VEDMECHGFQQQVGEASSGRNLQDGVQIKHWKVRLQEKKTKNAEEVIRMIAEGLKQILHFLQ